MTALSVRDLTYSYGRHVALRGVSIAVPRGEIVAVGGRNGSGKSTLASILAGLLRDFSGEAQILGRPARTWRAVELARCVGYVAQQTEMPFPYRAGEVVLMGRSPHQKAGLPFDRAEDVRVAREALEVVGASALAGRHFADLSGGERQLVVLASALAQQPEILILDEPTTSLDLNHRLRFARLLQHLRERHGLTIVVVTHDVELAVAFCDRVLLLKAGCLVADLRRGASGRIPLTSEILASVFDLTTEENPVRLVYA